MEFKYKKNNKIYYFNIDQKKYCQNIYYKVKDTNDNYHIIQINDLEKIVKCATSLDCSNAGNNTICVRWQSATCPCGLDDKYWECLDEAGAENAIYNGGRVCPAPKSSPDIGCIGLNKDLCNSKLYNKSCQWINSTNSCCNSEQYLMSPSGDQHISCINTDQNILAIINKYGEKIITNNIFNLQRHSTDNGNCNNSANPKYKPVIPPTCTKAIAGQCESVYTWSNLSKAISLYNKYIPKNISTIFKDGDVETNVKILAAFFANTYRETNSYLNCKELLLSVGTQVCETKKKGHKAIAFCPRYTQAANSCCGPSSYIGKYSSDYGGRTHLLCCDWNTKITGCNGSGIESYNECWKTKNINCKDGWNGDLSNEYCFFGRGAIQITYISNYNNINYFLKNIPLKYIDPNIKSEDKVDILTNPDIVCDNGIIAWLSALVYFGLTCPEWLSGKTKYTGGQLAKWCVGGDGYNDSKERQKKYINYLKKLGIQP